MFKKQNKKNADIGKHEIWGVWLEECNLIAGQVAQISMQFSVDFEIRDAFKEASIVTCPHGFKHAFDKWIFDLFIIVLSSAVVEVNYKRKCQLLVFSLIRTL